MKSILCVCLHRAEQVIRGQVHDGTPALDCLDSRLIDGDRSERYGARGDKHTANRTDIATRAQVHHSVRAAVHSNVHLAQFGADIAGVGRRTDVGVDLCAKALAYAARLQRMVDGVCGNDDGAIDKAGQYRLYTDTLRASDVFRLWRRGTFLGTFD